jgi:hypothetical protein
MRRRPATRSVAQQAFALRARYATASVRLLRGQLTCRIVLTPSSLSRSYTVQISYRLGGHPQVRVLNPVLDGRLGESLPHVYREGTLCLYLDGEWSSTMLLADSIVPWASEWLLFYELWVPGGEWHGGGEWPPPRTVGSLDAPRTEPPTVDPSMQD